MRIRILLLALIFGTVAKAADPVITPGTKTLQLTGESFQINGNDAFIILPENTDANATIPWVWYAPTLKGLPAQSENWMFEQFLAKGIAIAGIDVGESYGNKEGREAFSELHDYLVTKRKFSKKPCLLARSRGGLMLYNWAVENSESVGGVAGIYPVCNLLSYPGIKKAASAYGLTIEEFEKQLTDVNPIERLKPLAEAGVPIFHIHGDVDKLVPLDANSAELAKRYKAFGGSVEIEIAKDQGHNMWPGFFNSQTLTDFAIASALGKSVE